MSTEYKSVKIMVEGVVSGQNIEIGLIPNGANVSWSMGDDYSTNSGITITGLSGPFSANHAMIMPSQIVVQMGNFQSGPGGSVFEIDIFIAAGQGISSFYANQNSAPGVQITLQLGGNPPQQLNQGNTLFNWN